MAETRVDRYIASFNEHETVKRPWLPYFQALAETFINRKADFTSTVPAGDFLDDRFDDTGYFAGVTAASIFQAMLWPDSSRTFSIRPARRLRGVPGVEEYFNFVTEELRAAMDNPRAGLLLALSEHNIDQQFFGTSGIGAFEGPENDPSLPLVFEAWGIKNMCIAENAQGFVDMIFFKRKRTARQIVQEYSRTGDKIAPAILKAVDESPNDEFEILQVIEPNADYMRGKKGRMGMKCRTVHIDIKNKRIMRESGYQEMPVFVARFIKMVGEPYGRPAAGAALADANSLDALCEGVIIATEKQLAPPLLVMDASRLGGGVVDTSPDGISVYDSAGRISNEKPIQALYTVGEMQSAEKQQERFEQKIMQAFSLDRLLDLNNKVQMTAYETSVRDRKTGQSLGALFGRQIAETYTPLISRSFNVLYRSGRLGFVQNGIFSRVQRMWNEILGNTEQVVPPAVVKALEAGLDVFEIEYISPAQRFMQSEKLQGILTISDLLVQLGEILPGFKDNFDADLMAAYAVRFGGAPHDVKLTEKKLQVLRANIEKQVAAKEQLEATKQVSEVGRNTAQSVAALAPR